MTRDLRFAPSALLLVIAIITRASAQDSLYQGDGPDWVLADSNLVQDPPWLSATIPKNIVVLLFKVGTTEARRTAIIAMVHGTIIHIDSPGFYLIRVASHPDACGVKQAIDLLAHMPEVEMADPELAFTTGPPGTVDPGGSLTNLSASHHGSKRPCPAGTTLLQ